ncbi:MAG: nitroreductase family protein [Paludibacteraceae bacterium]|nr:nitroreductase family protein [Paludibacteraceae bacterium]
MRQFLLLLPLLAITLVGCNPTPQNKEPMNNEVINAIMSRRSIRQYHQMPVARDTMMQIMICGINAANGQNKQSWEVRIIDNPTTLQKVQDLMAAGNPNLPAEMAHGCMRGAPVMTFIARDRNYDFSAYDCGLLAGNMMLAAQSLGIGSICLGSPVRFINDAENSDDILALLGFSENYELCLCVGFGYANESPEAKPRDINKVQFVD